MPNTQPIMQDYPIKTILHLIALGAVAVCVSCETIIHPTLQSASSVLVVDAFVNNLIQDQVIKLTKSQPYLEQTIAPPVTGAQVEVNTNQGEKFIFSEDINKAGSYIWKPQNNLSFVKIGVRYTLSIIFENETYTATSVAMRVPTIDSITYKKQRPRRGSDATPVILGEFWATDPPGIGDAYWIRSYKNNMLFNFPSEINIAFDAGFSPGGGADGVTFLPPIRSNINATGNDYQFVEADIIKVEIHSISSEAFNFLNILRLQTDRQGGFSELFATPLANIPTNISVKSGSTKKGVGFFNVATTSVLSRRVAK